MFGLGRFLTRVPTLEGVAKELIQRLKVIVPQETFSFDARQEMLKGSAGTSLFLTNFFVDYCAAAKEARGAMLDKFLVGLSGSKIPETFADARPNLLPVLRHLGGLECAMILGGAPLAERNVFSHFALKSFSDELAVGVAFDTPDSVSQISGETLKKWGVSFDELLAIAFDNLRHKAAPAFAEFEPGLFVSQYNDYYDAARILLPELAHQLPLKGQPVAMVPNRVALILSGDQDAAGLEAMLATATSALQEMSRPLGTEMFRLENGAWKPWHPSGELGLKLHNLQVQHLADSYKAQQDALQQDAEQRGEDVFVATFGLFRQDGSERILSYSVLTKGVLSWIPKSDLIVLNDLDEDKQIQVTWEAFEREAGQLLESMATILPRFRVRQHPSDAQVQAMLQTEEQAQALG